MPANDALKRLIIRPAVETDEARTVELWRECGLVASHNNPHDDFRLARAAVSSDILLADENGRVVGSVMVGHDGHRGWIYYLASDPHLRLRGVGRALVDAADTWLRASGVRKVQILIRRSNIGVTAFYERLGFEQSDVVLMQRWLDRS